MIFSNNKIKRENFGIKKKLLLYVLSIVLLAALAMPVSAANASATLNVASVQAAQGETIVVDVSVNGTMAGMQVQLEYDPEVLTPVKIEVGPQLSNGWQFVPSSDLKMGRFIAVASGANVTVNGVVARYTYKVNSDAALGSSSLNVSQAIMTDSNGSGAEDFNAAVASHGAITVLPGTSDGSTNSGDSTTTSRSTSNSTSRSSSSPSSANQSKTNPKTGDTAIWGFWILIILCVGVFVARAIAKKQKS